MIEVHANDEFALTTRVYPWLSNSTGAGLLWSNVSGSSVEVSNLELWDGLGEYSSEWNLNYADSLALCSQRLARATGRLQY